MAAATTTGTRAAATQPAFVPSGHGYVCAAYGTVEVSSGMDEGGDIWQLCKVPAGAIVVGGWIYADDLDTGTEALDVDLGWAANGGSGTYDSADPDGLGNLGTWSGDAVTDLRPEVGIYYPLGGNLLNGDFPTFTEETTIQAEVNTAAGTLTAGAVSVCILYVVP